MYQLKLISHKKIKYYFTALQLSIVNFNHVGRDKSNQFESLFDASHDSPLNATNSMEQSIFARGRLQHDDASRVKQ